MADYNGISYGNGMSSQGYLYLSTISYSYNRNYYFRMMAYDTSANTWRTWIAAGAPDLAAVQYNGSAFPFTQVFVAARL